MDAVPVDGLHVWIALSVVVVAGASAALAVPTAPPPDAVSVANAVDRVAASGAPATASVPVAASAVRLGPDRVALRADGRSAEATLGAGRVTPVREGTLRAVLRGEPPEAVFASPAALAAAASAAREAPPHWTPVDDRITVRAVSWGGVDVTLVGV